MGDSPHSRSRDKPSIPKSDSSFSWWKNYCAFSCQVLSNFPYMLFGRSYRSISLCIIGTFPSGMELASRLLVPHFVPVQNLFGSTTRAPDAYITCSSLPSDLNWIHRQNSCNIGNLHRSKIHSRRYRLRNGSSFQSTTVIGGGFFPPSS